MEMNIFYYLQINITCIIILSVMLFSHLKHNKSNTTELVFLKKLIFMTIIYCISDIIAWHANGQKGNLARPGIAISNIVYMVIPCCFSYVWVEYVMYKTNNKNSKVIKRILYTPLVMLSVCFVSTPVTKFAFEIDSENWYHRRIGAYAGPIILYGYLFIALVIIIRYIKSEKNIIKKEAAYPLCFFYIPILIAGIFTMCIYGISINQTGFTISIILVFLNTQYGKISMDELTGLNNRREFKQYLNNMICTNNANTLFVCMIDVDYFKSINDAYGHMEGDMALKMVAGILKKVCSLHQQRFFLARYGGDEFVIAGVDIENEEIDKIVREIDVVCDETNQNSDKPYKIMLSAGYSNMNISEIEALESVITAADKAMYEVKQTRRVIR